MGKKIDSIKEMYSFGLLAPKCVFIMETDEVEDKLNEYFKIQDGRDRFCIRTDSNKSSMSLKRNLSATKSELIKSAYEWHNEYQIILQEFIGEENEIKSGNIYLNNDKIIIEGAKERHRIFTNGKALDVSLTVPRFHSYDFELHRFFKNQDCFSYPEILRLVRLARRVPYNNSIIEFSYVKNGNLYFWEIKKERTVGIK